MRVLHVEAGRHVYGGGAQVLHLIAALDSARVTNALVCAAGGALAARADIAARVMPVAMRGDADLGLVARLRTTIREFRPDVVHVHSRRGADLYGGIAARLAGAPAVLTRRVDSAEPLAALKYRAYRRVVAISRAVAAQLAMAGVEPRRIALIPSIVDVERVRPDAAARARVLAEFDLPGDALLVGVVAQLIARKRHDLLLAELPGIVSREPRTRVLCFGRGPLDRELRADVARRGLERHVLLPGFRADLAELLPGLDLVVHPADREGLGVALLEAASSAVPVIAAAVGGVVDAVEHGHTGLLFPPGDGPALAAAMLALFGSPAERRRLGANARACAERRCRMPAFAAAHLSLYTAAVAEAVEPRLAGSSNASAVRPRKAAP